jgi:hypothetical protein
MRALLLCLAAPIAAATMSAAPAAALDPAPPRIAVSSAAGVTVHHGLPPQYRDGDRDRRRRWSGDSVLIYDRDYQGDTAWRSNSFNDWWHDRPDRSYPKWVANNQDCQRMWWSGGGWRC